MNWYKKQAIGEILKALIGIIVGALCLWFFQKWATNELEYKVVSKNSYLSSTLNQQGLAMAYAGKTVKNVSIVEFAVFNRTEKQFNDVELTFYVKGKENEGKMLSADILTPNGMPKTEIIEEIPSKDPLVKKYKIKVIPTHPTEYFHTVFVFEGEKSPDMGVNVTSKDCQIIEFKEWKDNSKLIVILVIFMLVIFMAMNFIMSLIEFYDKPKFYKKRIAEFEKIAEEMKNNHQLKSNDVLAIEDAKTIFKNYTKPRMSAFWTKILGSRDLD